MKKDVVYSIRMRSNVRDSLRRAAKLERRTVASLLDKIILDYLEKEGYLQPSHQSLERRGTPRKQLTIPATLTVQNQEKKKSFPGIILNVSSGGILVTYPKGMDIQFNAAGSLPEFEISFQLPEQKIPIQFQCNARRMTEIGDQIQIGAIFEEIDMGRAVQLENYLN